VDVDLPTKEDWNAILKDAAALTFVRNDVIIQEGDQHQRIYQITNGECRIEKIIDGSPQTLGTIQREIFGEITFLQGGRATASVIANSEKVELYMVEGYALKVLFELKPGLAGRFFKYLASIAEKRLWEREQQHMQES